MCCSFKIVCERIKDIYTNQSRKELGTKIVSLSVLAVSSVFTKHVKNGRQLPHLRMSSTLTGAAQTARIK